MNMTMIFITGLTIVGLIIVIAILARKNKSLAEENRSLALDKARADERLAVINEQSEKNETTMRERFAAMASESLQQNSKAK